VLNRGLNLGNTYVPVVPLPPQKEAEKLLTHLMAWTNNGKEYGGENAFNYVLTELVIIL
jgi:hypothetical protein